MTTQEVTAEFLRDRWQPLDVSPPFFQECRKHPAHFIPAEGYERHYYFFDCEEIVFREENGTQIWVTKGQGHIVLPKEISISIKNGKTKHVDLAA